MQKVYLATSRDIGKKCFEWAKQNTPEDFEIVETMNHCDIVISVLYDKILSPEYLSGLNGRAYNFHPAILPEYRGSADYSWAIVNGEKEVGVTLHVIDSGVDTGDIIEIRRFPLFPWSTAQSVFADAEAVIFQMFKDHYVHLLTGKFATFKQDTSKAHTYKRSDLERLKDLTPIVRALHFPPKESCFYFNSKGEKIYIDYEKTQGEQH